MDEQRAAIRRTLAWILVGALCIAALTAIAAVLSGDFDDTDARVIGTSLGFAVFSATGATGATLRLRQSENLRTLGLATVVVSALAFLLLLLAMWNEGADDDALWRWWGAATLATFACSHASLMGGALRPGDSDAVRLLGVSSIALACVDSGIGILAVAEVFEDVEESAGQLLAVLVILMILTTALTPIVRRLQRTAPPPPDAATRAEPASAPSGPPAPAAFAAEVIATADRIEALNADPGNRAPEIRREVQRLRELARLHSR
jgi:hypothetical protein